MKRISLIGSLTLAAACMAGYGLPAAAQSSYPSSSSPAPTAAPMAAPAETPPPSTGMAPAKPMNHGSMAKETPDQHMQHVEKHIKDLHAKLGITKDQQSKFDDLSQAMRDEASTMYAARKERMDHAKDATAVDELQSYGDLAQAHADAIKKLVPTFKTLYDSLSDAQKKKADALFRRHEEAKMKTH